MTGIFFFALGFLLLPASLVRSAWMSLLCSLPPPPNVLPTHFPQPFSFMALGCPKSRTLALSPLCACMTKKDQGSRKRMVTPNGQCSSPFPLPPPLSSIPFPIPLSFFISFFFPSEPPFPSCPLLPPFSWASEVASSKWLCPNGSCKRKSEHATAKRKWNGWGG